MDTQPDLRGLSLLTDEIQGDARSTERQRSKNILGSVLAAKNLVIRSRAARFEFAKITDHIEHIEHLVAGEVGN